MLQQMNKCLEYAHRLVTIVSKFLILLSGGIDTSFIALVIKKAGLDRHVKTLTIAYDRNAKDLKYASEVARVLNLRHEAHIATEEEIRYCKAKVLKALKVIDPIEVVCSILICIGLIKSRELGCEYVITGDGSDEIFFGYDFLLNLPKEKLDEWSRRVITNARFSSLILSDYLSIKVLTPFFTNEVKLMALEIPLECKINIHRGRKYGKYLLRIYLENEGLGNIAWRSKDPIMFGSNFHKLLSKWRINDMALIIKLCRDYEVRLPSYPHAYLLMRLLELGIKPPPKCSKGNSCPLCGRCLEGVFCRFCGTYITKEGISYYRDELDKELKPLLKI